MALESPFVFYPRYWAEVVRKHWQFIKLIGRLLLVARRVKRDPNGDAYMDVALTHAAASDRDTLEMFTHLPPKPAARTPPVAARTAAE